MKVVSIFLSIFIGSVFIPQTAFSAETDMASVVAVVGDKEILMSDLVQATEPDMQQINIQIYDIQNRALKRMVDNELVAQEAKALLPDSPNHRSSILSRVALPAGLLPLARPSGRWPSRATIRRLLELEHVPPHRNVE